MDAYPEHMDILQNQDFVSTQLGKLQGMVGILHLLVPHPDPLHRSCHQQHHRVRQTGSWTNHHHLEIGCAAPQTRRHPGIPPGCKKKELIYWGSFYWKVFRQQERQSDSIMQIRWWCVCVCVKHLNRCKTSFRFAFFRSVFCLSFSHSFVSFHHVCRGTQHFTGTVPDMTWIWWTISFALLPQSGTSSCSMTFRFSTSWTTPEFDIPIWSLWRSFSNQVCVCVCALGITWMTQSNRTILDGNRNVLDFVAMTDYWWLLQIDLLYTFASLNWNMI